MSSRDSRITTSGECWVGGDGRKASGSGVIEDEDEATVLAWSIMIVGRGVCVKPMLVMCGPREEEEEHPWVVTCPTFTRRGTNQV